MTLRPKLSGGRVIVAAAALAVAVVAVSGCSKATERTGFLEFEDLNSLYVVEVEAFPWELPQGESFPARIPIDDTGGLWESNNARAQAYFYWQCAWIGDYFSEREQDSSNAQHALDQLRTGATDETYVGVFLEDPDRGWLGVLDKADLGDARELKSFFDVSCRN